MIIFKNDNRSDPRYRHRKGDIHIIFKNGKGIRLKDGLYQFYPYYSIRKILIEGRNDQMYMIPKIKLISGDKCKMFYNSQYKDAFILYTINGYRTIYDLNNNGSVMTGVPPIKNTDIGHWVLNTPVTKDQHTKILKSVILSTKLNIRKSL